MIDLFCLKANSNPSSNTAPKAKYKSVAVTPDARNLFKTIMTNTEGANAHTPMMKLLISSIAAVDLSRNSCLIRLFIMWVFN